MKAIAILAVLLMGSALSGCATVTMGTTQDLTVDSEPQAAECRLERRGVAFAHVKPTPGKVTVQRSGDTLVLICSLDGYEPVTEHVAPSFSGATIGNVLAGGLIGIAIDAASGANNSYPQQLRAVLTPSAFDTVDSRDRHFALAAQKVRERADTEAKEKRSRCSTTQKELCDIEVRQVEENRERMLALIETKRQSAKIGAGGHTVAATAPAVSPPPVTSGAPRPTPLPQTPVAAASIVSPTSPLAHVPLPPGRDGVWRGIYSCRGSSTVSSGDVDAAITVQNGSGEQKFASTGAQTHKLALAIVGGTARMTRTSETTSGRPHVTVLNGTVEADTITFNGSETALTSNTGYGASLFTYCTARLQRGV